MLEPDYIHEPTLGLIHDYWNEAASLLFRLKHSLEGMGISNTAQETTGKFLSKIDNTIFLQAIIAARGKKKIQTLHERFLDPNSSQRYVDPKDHEQVVNWMSQSSLRAKRIDEIADTLNTTMDVLQFKKAYNELHGVIYGRDYQTFSIVEETPTVPVSGVPVKQPIENKL